MTTRLETIQRLALGKADAIGDEESRAETKAEQFEAKADLPQQPPPGPPLQAP